MGKIHVTERDGSTKTVEATPGAKIMEVIRDAGLDIEAACGGCAACATCHVYVDPEWKDKLQEASEEELDMLDLAMDVTDESRLSCQIEFDESLNGMKVTLAPA